jgi:nicotinate-nucleotide adenylyltransferase
MLRTRYTADFVRMLEERASRVRFVWIMGSDNLAGFHRWDRWRKIAASMPIAVVNRPGSLAAPLSSPAATALARWRIDEADALTLADRLPPAWVFLSGPRTAVSSSSLRAGAEAS